MGRMVTVLAMLALYGTASAQVESIPEDRIMSRSLIEEFGSSLGITGSSTARPLSKLALEMIKDFEGWEAAAYNDPAGYCTIGYGHLIALERCSSDNLGKFVTSLTLAQGEEILKKDTLGSRLAVQQMVRVDINANQFDALTSFVFNVGKRNFKKSTLLRILNNGHADIAAREFSRWVKADNKVYPGLVVRRSCEQALFEGKLALVDGRFDRASCTTLGAAPSAGTLIDIEVGEQSPEPQ